MINQRVKASAIERPLGDVTRLEAKNMRLIYSIHLLVGTIFVVIIGISSSLNSSASPEPFLQSGLVHKTRGEIERSAIKRVEPDYPPLVKAAQLQGTVDVGVVIDEEGTVISARALIGHSMLKGAALEAARGWKFMPTKVKGAAVKVMGPITFIFKGREFNDRQDEIEFYVQEARENPRSALARYNLGNVYHKNQRYQEAIDEHKRAIGIDPDFALAYYALGDAYYVLNRYEEAAEEYKQAIRLKPDFIEAHYYLGGAYERLKRPVEAVKVFEDLLKISQDLDVAQRAYINISVINKRLGHIEEALSAYRRLVDIEKEWKTIDPNTLVSPDVSSNTVAILYEKMGRNEEAIAAYRQTISLAPYSDSAFYAYLSIANIYEKTNRKEEAGKVYEETLEISFRAIKASKGRGMTSAAYSGLGFIYERMGRNKEALEAYKKAANLNPDSVKAHQGLARVYLKIGDKESAHREYLIIKRLDEEEARDFEMLRDLKKKP